jgi:hypothetical protein
VASTTTKELSFPGLFTIKLVFLVQRGDDIDLAALSPEDTASPR